MGMATLQDSINGQAIARALSGEEGRQVIGIDELSGTQRSFSETTEIRVRFEDGAGRYIVKKPLRSAESRFESQRNAEAIFEDEDFVTPTKPVFVPEAGVIVSRFVEGRSFEHDFALGRPSDLASWRQRLDTGIRMAGTWLRRFHAHSLEAHCAESLVPYLEKRRAPLRRLSEPMAERVWALARAPFVGPSAVIHGDFCPHNILFSGNHISVIDCGMEEWKRFSPFWDSVCFAIAIEEIGQFHIRSPLHWMPRKCDAMLASFFAAYGSDPRAHPDYLKCLAVRHLTYVLCDGDGKTFTKRGAWHLKQLENALSRATI